MSVLIVAGAIILDIITGLIKALKNKNLNSTKIREGLYNKVSEILALIFAYGIEYVTNYIKIGTDIPTVGFVSTYIIITEIISIVENLCETNKSIYKLFSPFLEKLKTTEENHEKRN